MSQLPTPSQKEEVVLELLIARGEMYGLELVHRSNGRLKRGTVYVTLGRMEDKGLVRSRREEQVMGKGPPRRLYEVTGLGERLLAAQKAAARSFARSGLTMPSTVALALGMLYPASAWAGPEVAVARFGLALGGLIVLSLALFIFWRRFSSSKVLRRNELLVWSHQDRDHLGQWQTERHEQSGQMERWHRALGDDEFRRQLQNQLQEIYGALSADELLQVISKSRHMNRQYTLHLSRDYRKLLVGKRSVSRRSQRVHRVPGSTLRYFAKLLFTRRTYMLVFEPLLADLHLEYIEALGDGAFRRAKWIQVKYTCAFFAAAAARLPTSVVRLMVGSQS